MDTLLPKPTRHL